MNAIEILEVNIPHLYFLLEWTALIKGLERIPSQNFRLFRLKTDLFTSDSLSQLAEVILRFNQSVTVDIRCDKLTLRISVEGGTLLFAPLKGYLTSFDRVKTHRIVKYVCEATKSKIYVYYK